MVDGYAILLGRNACVFAYRSTYHLYHSAAAGIANVFFFPPLVALILSFGYIKARIALLDLEDDTDPQAYFEWRRRRYGPSGTLREFDPLDSASGSLWVGNPLNPLNPGYINRRPS